MCSSNSLTNLDITQNTALTMIGCANNSLTSLDVTQNTALTSLACFSNSLVGLDVTQNTALTTLNCGFTTLNSLDVSQNTSLTTLELPGNPLTSLNVTQNTALTTLKVYSGSLISIDVSQNTALTTLWVQENSLTTLDISQNLALENLSCRNNSLTSLDVSQHTALAALWCSNNSLSTLNVANGNNTNFTNFIADNNPSLTCITVDDVAYSTTNWTNIDAQTSFSTNCATPCTVNIPDANFKNYLVGNTNINTNGDTEIQCSEATAFTGTINITSAGVSNLTGIEAFTNLTSLQCNNNSLTSVDLSQNTLLTQLQISSNSISTLDVSNNTLLTELLCSYNSLTSIDVSLNTALVIFNCSGNAITVLDVSANTSLQTFGCNGNNSITALNIANGNNTNIINFSANNNPNLTCIQVDDAAYSTTNWTNIDAQTSFSTNCNPTGKIYVNHAATGSNNGASWANAYTHLETALASATDGDEIWVATGTYLPNTTGSQTTPFSVNNADLKIYGGFAGTETNVNQRILGTNETILSGDFNGNDVFVNDHLTNNFNHGSKTDNSRHIITITAAGNNLVLDGLTVSNAHYTTNTVSGAIMKEKTVSKLTLKNCTIKNNVSAAGSGLVTEFELNNTSGTRGELIIENCMFRNNMSRYASGIYSYARDNTDVDIRVENTLFDNNISGNLSTGLRGLSGPVSWFRTLGADADINLKLINNTYVNNICDSDGQSISDYNRATVVINKTAGTLNAEVVNNIFWNNYRPTSTSNNVMKSVSDTYQTAANSIVVKNSIDQLNFNDASITSTTATSNANPLFTNINNDFTLQASSPAIDTGDNNGVTTTTDLAGNVRVHNGTVDMGVYEYGSLPAIDRTLTINATNGTVTTNPNPNSNGVYNNGEVISLTATPAAGYQFDNWSGDATGTTNPVNITMDADKTVTANFSLIQAPVPTFVNSPTNISGAYTATINFSSAVTGFNMSDITVTGATLSNFTAVSGTEYTVLVTPTSICGTAVTLQVPANVAQNASSVNNVASVLATINAVDTINPTVVAQNFTLQLDANGQGTLTVANIDNGSTDNCAIATRVLDKTSFNCSNVGANTVKLTVTDSSGNSSDATATVTVVDSIVPTVVTQNITVQLGTNGQVSILASNIYNSTSDNCSVTSVSADKTNFTCNDVGANTVTLTVQDASGNQNTATATVTVTQNPNARECNLNSVCFFFRFKNNLIFSFYIADLKISNCF